MIVRSYLVIVKLIGVFIMLLVSTSANADITGKARVVDGDTIWIDRAKLRLHGIDAPEIKQTCRTKKGKEQKCGILAKQALEQLVKRHGVICKGKKTDRYKRLIAVCYVKSLNINEQMVADGWALAYRKYSKDYVRAEAYAKSRRKGMWNSNFKKPWEWRRKRR